MSALGLHEFQETRRQRKRKIEFELDVWSWNQVSKSCYLNHCFRLCVLFREKLFSVILDIWGKYLYVIKDNEEFINLSFVTESLNVIYDLCNNICYLFLSEFLYLVLWLLKCFSLVS
jgi:hypothetical protein